MSKVLDQVAIEPHPLGLTISRLFDAPGAPFRRQADLMRHLKMTPEQARSTLNRFKNDPAAGFSYATLADLAERFKVEPWMLLIPGFDPLELRDKQFWESTFALWNSRK